jgi:hypothetical protein
VVNQHWALVIQRSSVMNQLAQVVFEATWTLRRGTEFQVGVSGRWRRLCQRAGA